MLYVTTREDIKMHQRPILSVLLSFASVCGAGISSVQADGLVDNISGLFGPNGITLIEQPIPPTPGAGGPTVTHTAHFTSDSLATLGLLTQQLASSAADFPAISTVPGFTFRYNPALQAFERSSENLGPVFVERPHTVGRGKVDVGLSYLYVNFDELEGEQLDGLTFRGLRHNDCCPLVGNPNAPDFETDTADLLFEEFDLESHVLSVFATYGITDRWDVNLLIPIIVTNLDITARAAVNNESRTDTHSFEPVASATDPRVTQLTRSVDDSATGVGDLLLRTKYHFLDADDFDLASGLTLRIPTGDEDDFQGIGDTTLTPFFSVSQVYGPIDLHLSTGVEINTEDLDRTRVRYGAGATYQIGARLALLADVIGSSGVANDELSVEVPRFVNSPAGSATINATNPTDTVSSDIRTDIVDLALGIKANFGPSAVGFISFFVPLNDEGLRAEVIPATGLEVSF